MKFETWIDIDEVHEHTKCNLDDVEYFNRKMERCIAVPEKYLLSKKFILNMIYQKDVTNFDRAMKIVGQ